MLVNVHVYLDKLFIGNDFIAGVYDFSERIPQYLPNKQLNTNYCFK